MARKQDGRMLALATVTAVCMAVFKVFILPKRKILNMTKVYASVFIVAILAIVLGNGVGAYNIFSLLNLKEIWLKRPYNGPEVVVEIIGADLNRRANRFFDRWSNPDTFVIVEHGKLERHTQIEGNTYQPRFLWKTKMPFRKSRGFRFQVNEANVLRDTVVMGRAFIDIDRVAEMMNTGEPALLSLGESIGVLKVMVTHPPHDLKEHGVFSSHLKQLDAP